MKMRKYRQVERSDWMKVAEIIAAIDELRPNEYSASMKTKWLSECEGTIVDEVLRATTLSLKDMTTRRIRKKKLCCRIGLQIFTCITSGQR